MNNLPIAIINSSAEILRITNIDNLRGKTRKSNAQKNLLTIVKR